MRFRLAAEIDARVTLVKCQQAGEGAVVDVAIRVLQVRIRPRQMIARAEMPSLQSGEETLERLVSFFRDEDGLMLAHDAAEVTIGNHDREDFLAAHLGIDEFRMAPL